MRRQSTARATPANRPLDREDGRFTLAVAGYMLAGIAVFLAFLYLRFPGEAITDYVNAVYARHPGSAVTVDRIGPSFPPGLTATKVTVGFRGQPEATLQADTLSLRPRGLSLLQGQWVILLAATGYGGDAEGRIDFSRIFSFREPRSVEATLRNLKMERCAWLQQTLARRITGTLQGSLSFRGMGEAMKNMTGNADFTLTNGAYPLIDGFLDIKKIDFSRIEGKLSLLNGTLKITELTLTGETLRASLKGNIFMADEFRESRIDLSGTIEMPTQGNRRLTVNIGGTLDNPKTRLM